MVAATAKFLAPAHARISDIAARMSINVPCERVLALGLILVLLQIADGCLTGMGISLLGTEAEGNPLLRTLMEQFGMVPALIITKTLAIVVIAVLCILSGAVRWLEGALKVVIGIYLLAAVIPWTIILTINLA